MKHPNLVVEKLLQDLPIYCQNYRRKCPQSFDEVKDLEEHEKTCNFRKLYCQNYIRKGPIRRCLRTFDEFEDREEHQKICKFRLIFCPHNLCRKKNNGAYLQLPFLSWAQHCSTEKHIDDRYRTKHIVPKQPKRFSLSSVSLIHRTLFQFFILPNNVELCLIGQFVNNIVMVWICINGSPSEADKISYQITYGGHYQQWRHNYKTDKSLIKYHVKSLEENPHDIITNQETSFRISLIEMDVVEEMDIENRDFIIVFFLEKPKRTWAQKLFNNNH